jgi:hypothetical protein
MAAAYGSDAAATGAPPLPATRLRRTRSCLRSYAYQLAFVGVDLRDMYRTVCSDSERSTLTWALVRIFLGAGTAATTAWAWSGPKTARISLLLRLCELTSWGLIMTSVYFLCAGLGAWYSYCALGSTDGSYATFPRVRRKGPQPAMPVATGDSDYRPPVLGAPKPSPKAGDAEAGLAAAPPTFASAPTGMMSPHGGRVMAPAAASMLPQEPPAAPTAHQPESTMPAGAPREGADATNVPAAEPAPAGRGAATAADEARRRRPGWHAYDTFLRRFTVVSWELAISFEGAAQRWQGARRCVLAVRSVV